MEVRSAFRVPVCSSFLASSVWVVTEAVVLFPESVSRAAAIGRWLVTEGAIVPEIRGAMLPEYGADTVVASFAVRVAEASVFLLAISADGDGFSDTTPVSVLPTVGC